MLRTHFYRKHERLFIADAAVSPLPLLQTPSNMAAQYLTPQASASPSSDVEELTDSDKEIDGDRETLSDSDNEDHKTQRQDRQKLEGSGIKMGKLLLSSTTSPTTLPAGRTLVLVPGKVICVCANRATQGRLRVGECSSCSKVFHLACQARNSAGQRGWMCLDCAAGSLKAVDFDPRYLTYIDENDLQDAAPGSAISRGSPTETSPAKEGDSEHSEEILCICPNRFDKVRTRLARCVECELVAHISCRVRTQDDTPGFLCLYCPGGHLELVPDVIIAETATKKAMSARSSARRGLTDKVKKLSPLTTMRSGARPTRSQFRVVQQPVDDGPSTTTPDEPSPRRHNLRQKNVPNMKDRPTRAARKPRVTGTQPSSRPAHMHQHLVFMAEEIAKIPNEPRTTNLHEVFLRDIPANALWRQYCILPDGIATNADVLKATEVEFGSYRVEPVNAVPEVWVREFKYRLGRLLDAATSDGQVVRLMAKQWEKDVGLALRHVGDIAREVLHHGSYKGKRARLGLLAEVLGLSEKGTFWKGGERFGGG